MANKTDAILAAWSEFFVSHALCVREIETRIRTKAPLGLDEYDLLLVISRTSKERIRLSALAEATIYTKSGISRIVRRMESAGYLRKESCPHDRRGSFAVITDRGKRALADTWHWYSSAVLEIFEPCFSDLEDVRTLAELLSRIVRRIRSERLVKPGRW